MTYRLYHVPGSAAEVVRVLLDEIGAPYELLKTTIDMSEPRPAAQMALNPNGWVPVLIYGDQAMYEAAAITIFLCDRHPEAALAPPLNAPERGLFLQTLVYFSNSVQTAFQMHYYPDRFVDASTDEASVQRRGHRRLRETWGVINAQIADQRWVLGDRFSAADIYLHMLTTWFEPDAGHPDLSEFPNVARIAAACASRPSIRAAYGL